MTARLARLLQEGAPEPVRLLDADTIVKVARRRRTWQRAAAASGTVVLVLAAVAIPSLTSEHHRSSAPPATVTPTPKRSIAPSSKARLAPNTVTPSTEVPATGFIEGPIIAWDVRLPFSSIVPADKLAAFPGLAFVAVLPRFAVPPTRIDASKDSKSGSVGGRVELHYTFPTSAAFPDDGRVIVTERAGGLDSLTGLGAPSGGTTIQVAGHLCLLLESRLPPDGQLTSTLFTVRGRALITITGPAVPRAQALKLAAEL